MPNDCKGSCRNALWSAEIVVAHALVCNRSRQSVVIDKAAIDVGEGDVTGAGQVDRVIPHSVRRVGTMEGRGDCSTCRSPVGGVSNLVSDDPDTCVVCGRCRSDVLGRGGGVVE